MQLYISDLANFAHKQRKFVKNNSKRLLFSKVSSFYWTLLYDAD